MIVIEAVGLRKSFGAARAGAARGGAAPTGTVREAGSGRSRCGRCAEWT